MDSKSSWVLQKNSKIIKGPEFVFPYTKGIGQMIFENLRNTKLEIAQIDGLTGEKEAYDIFTQKCIRTAITMRSKGITSEDIITICSFNNLNVYIPMIASFFLNVKFANTDPHLSVSDTIFLLNQVKPKMIFVSANSIKLIEDALQETGIKSEIVVFGETAIHSPFSQFLCKSECELDFTPVNVTDLNETAAIFFSSGTTGLSKGICLNHKTLLSKTVIGSEIYKLPHSTVLTTSSPYWISLTVSLLSTIISKGCRIVVPEITTNNIWQLIEKYKVTLLIISCSKMAEICQSGRPENTNLSSLSYISFRGACLGEEIIQKARKMFSGSQVFTGYGLTEVGGSATYFFINSVHDLEVALRKVTSSGQISPGFTLKIVDIEEETVLGPNKLGEIRIKTEYHMNGYYNLDASNEWDEHGFLKTGDVGYYDEDRFIYVTSRIKEMLKFKGWHITPIKLESILMAHPAVQTALVIGIPHPIDNEHPMGLVILKEGYESTITADEIQKFVDNQVDNIYKLRGGVKIVKKLEKTPSEKYKRKYIKDLVLSGKI